LKLDGQNVKDFKFDSEDIESLFKTFGKIKNIEMNNYNHSAIIIFDDEISALFSIKFLNNFEI